MGRDPPRLQTLRRAGPCPFQLHGRPGALLSVGASPGADRMADPRTAPSHLLARPGPPPPLWRARAPASPAPPALGSLYPAAAPGSSPGAPAFNPGLGSASGGARDGEGGRVGALGARALPAWEAAPTGAGTQGKARTGRPAEGRARSSATPVTSGATRLPFSSFPPLLSPSPVGEGKVAVAAPCPPE